MSSRDPNPYEPPKAMLAPNPSGLAEEGACPQCQSTNVHRPTFTWWGGALGPKLFNHAVCRSCKFGFNYKTGKSNSTAIGIYFGVGIALGLVIVVIRASM
jgi:hypothetical protein